MAEIVLFLIPPALYLLVSEVEDFMDSMVFWVLLGKAWELVMSDEFCPEGSGILWSDLVS